MATYNKYTAGVEALVEGINSGSDTWKIALSNSINAADTTFTPGTTDLVTGGGYTQGGNTATVSTSTHSAGTYKLVLNSPSAWTGSGGGPSAKYDKELIRRRKIQQGYLKDDEELLAIMIATLTRRKK